MTDTNVDLQEQNLPQEPEYTEIELAAMNEGWKPRDQYEGDPAQWRDATLFMTLKPFYEKIESQGKRLKQNEKQFLQIAKDMQLVKVQQYEKALRDLKDARKEALHDGDIDRAELIADQIDNVKEQARVQQSQQVEQSADTNSEFISWKGRNGWYDTDEDLKDWADARGQRLHSGGMTPDEVLRQLEREVKTKFPEKFKNPNRERPGAVATGTPSNKPAKADTSGMTREEQRIMNTIVGSGVMTEAEYLKEFNKQAK